MDSLRTLTDYLWRESWNRAFWPSLALTVVASLPLLSLPRGFEYVSYGWTGDMMNDGLRTPSSHDGMAAFASARASTSIAPAPGGWRSRSPRCIAG